ncbi:MAG: peptidoglycan DD-metalloendopeptidase family protein [candidate division FCPU426 bacterium]
MTSRLIGVAALLLGVFTPLSAAAATPQELQEQLNRARQDLKQERRGLKEMREQIRQTEQTVRQKRRRERSILSEIQQVGQKIEEAEAQHEEQVGNLRLVRTAIANLQFKLKQNQAAVDQLRALLAVRLRLLYREQQAGFWRTLLTSPSLSQGLARVKFFHVLAAQNGDLIRQMLLRRTQMLSQQAELGQREDQASDLEEAARRTVDKIKAHKLSREKILGRVRQERTEQEEALRELNEASQRLTALIAELERRARRISKRLAQSGRQFAQQRRALPWPTRGRVVTRFGRAKHPRFNTYILHKGIDIAGAMGQNVFSVAQGEVLFAEWFEGYGRMVILDHGAGFNSVYAHLQKILVSEGQTVQSGQVIGELGDSGTWKGPVLYFEIRRRGEALDPLEWLER